MDILQFKTLEELQEDGIERLSKTMLDVSTSSSGKITRLFLTLINEALHEAYTMLEINHAQAFLSTATGVGLDNIGLMLSCRRLNEESDEDYRYRIANKVLESEAANLSAIRLAALSTENINDIITKENVYGAGSFVVYCTGNEAIVPEDTLALVKENINKVVAYGTQFEVLNPKIKDVKMNIILSFNPNISDEEQIILIGNIKTQIISIINIKEIGSSLIIKEILNTIIKQFNELKNIEITSLLIDNNTVFIQDQYCLWNERFLISAEGLIIEGV